MSAACVVGSDSLVGMSAACVGQRVMSSSGECGGGVVFFQGEKSFGFQCKRKIVETCRFGPSLHCSDSSPSVESSLKLSAEGALKEDKGLWAGVSLTVKVIVPLPWRLVLEPPAQPWLRRSASLPLCFPTSDSLLTPLVRPLANLHDAARGFSFACHRESFLECASMRATVRVSASWTYTLCGFSCDPQRCRYGPSEFLKVELN